MGRELLIDISAAVNQGAGIGRYARELTEQLIPRLDPEQTRLWYAEQEPAFDPGLLERAPWSRLPIRKAPISRLNVDRLFVRQSLPIARILRLGRPQEIYSPDFTAPEVKGARTHITVHDLAWLHPEARTPEPLARFLGTVVERAVHEAATVFTVSQAIRDEILQVYGIPEGRVFVAPNAPSRGFHGAEPLDGDRLVTFGLHTPFLLAVGTIEPRKNLATLIEALPLVPSGIQLAIVGRAGWDAKSILGRVDELGLTGRVIRLGNVPDETLARLMASAAALVYPSFYEGFGLPIVEAMAAGAPVVVSDIPVFREVGGDVAIYATADDVSSFAEAIGRGLAQADDLAARQARIEHALRFDWSQSAEIVAARLGSVG